jgi:hypothetical protein
METDTPPPPDIARDRIVVFLGGATTSFTEEPRVLVRGEAEIYLAPTYRPAGWTAPDPAPALPYYADGLRVVVETYVGTVDEICEDFRTSLTRAFEGMACRGKDGTYQTIPKMGEASLRRQTEVLAATVGDKFQRLPAHNHPTPFAKVVAEQPACTETAEQVMERLALACAVNAYRHVHEGGFGPPTGRPAREWAVRLRDALTAWIAADGSWGGNRMTPATNRGEDADAHS